MDEDKKNIDFDFHIHGLGEDKAEKLLDMIIAFVESHGLEMGGGFFVVEDEDEPDAA